MHRLVKRTIPALAAMALTGCAAPSIAGPPPASPPLTWAALGERVYVDGPQVTPLAIVEDSRCPQAVQCVWAGRLRIRATVHLGTGDKVHELTLGEPIAVADGSLELVDVRPEKGEAAIPPGDYRFGFRFMGGL